MTYPPNNLRPGSKGHTAVDLVRAGGPMTSEAMATALEVGEEELAGLLAFPLRLDLLRWHAGAFLAGDGTRPIAVPQAAAAPAGPAPAIPAPAAPRPVAPATYETAPPDTSKKAVSEPGPAPCAAPASASAPVPGKGLRVTRKAKAEAAAAAEKAASVLAPVASVPAICSSIPEPRPGMEGVDIDRVHQREAVAESALPTPAEIERIYLDAALAEAAAAPARPRLYAAYCIDGSYRIEKNGQCIEIDMDEALELLQHLAVVARCVA